MCSNKLILDSEITPRDSMEEISAPGCAEHKSNAGGVVSTSAVGFLPFITTHNFTFGDRIDISMTFQKIQWSFECFENYLDMMNRVNT